MTALRVIAPIALLLLLATQPALAGGTHGSEPALGGFDMHAFVPDALRGDIRDYVPVLDGHGPADARLQQLRERFGAEPAVTVEPTGSDLLDAALATYREFWRQALRGEIPPGTGDATIRTRVDSLLAERGIERAEDADALDTLVEALRDEGWYVQGGRTRPHEDLYVWRKQETETYQVSLHDTEVEVTVHFMSDFVSKGWMAYATLGMSHAGGWAQTEALYCVSGSYDRDSEAFRVSYLTHEGRHFADYGLFPSLEQTDLEYRAKLTELIFAEQNLHHLLENFGATASPTPSSPHALAAHGIVADFEQATGDEFDPAALSADPDRVRQIARDSLDAHSALLESRGAETITGVIEERFSQAIESARS